MTTNEQAFSTSPLSIQRADDGTTREESYLGNFLAAGVVEKKHTDIIFHLGNPHEDFRQVLTEVANDFFSDSETLGIEYIPEVDSFSLHALGMSSIPTSNPWDRAKKFLDLLDRTLGAIQ